MVIALFPDADLRVDAVPDLQLVGPGWVPTRSGPTTPARAFRSGSDVSTRRRRRCSSRVRRRRVAVGAAVVAAMTLLALPARALGGTADPQSGVATAAGSLPVSVQAGEGTFYVVQPGDTLAGIAQRLDPSDPARARARLVAQLGSATVVPGEHVELP
jgi:hypothetical protein